jgi:hypothetical protein
LRGEPQTWDCIFHLYSASLNMIGKILDLHQVVEGIYHKSAPLNLYDFQSKQPWLGPPSPSLLTTLEAALSYQCRQVVVLHPSYIICPQVHFEIFQNIIHHKKLIDSILIIFLILTLFEFKLRRLISKIDNFFI